MISAKEASAVTKANKELREVLDNVEKEIMASAQRGYSIATISFVKEEQIYPVFRFLRMLGYIVTQSKVRNDKGNYNLSVAWE